MKKLLISIVATASLALVAKADVAPNATSFETYPENVAFSVDLDDNGTNAGEKYWSGGDQGSEFLIKALAGEGGLGAKSVDRPKSWKGTTPDANALSIDTDVALSRHVNAGRTAQEIVTDLYFDSMVQFTATDTAPTVTKTADGVTGDKLIVWMREVVAGNETPATYALYVTAGVKDQSEIKTTHYELTSVAGIVPDSWHRLTIAISKTGETPTFKVYVDGVVAKSAKIYNPDGEDQTFEQAVEEFGSLTSAQETNSGTLTSVSFQGKGAIDDLVWTTEDPFAPDTISYSVIVDDTVGSMVAQAKYKYGAGDEVEVGLYEDDEDETADFALAVPEDATSVTFIFPEFVEGGSYEIEGGAFVDGVATITVPLPVEGAQINLKVIETVVVAKPFTVNGVAYKTLAGAISNANGATITVTEDAELAETVEIAANTTINFNGKTLTSTADCAIKVTAGILTLTGEGGITAPWVVIQQGTKNGGETTTVNVDANVKLLSRNELPKTGNNGFGDNVVYLCGKATLNVAGTLETDSDYYCAIQTSGADELADVAIKIEGTVINNNEVAIGLNLHKNAKGSLIVAEGAIIKGKSGIYAKSGSVTINGGTITATGKLGDASNEPGGTATGNALVVDKNSGYADLAVAVTGGTFNGYNGEAAIASVGEEIVGFVTGGQFNTEIDAVLLAEGKGLKKDGDNWTVAQTYQVSATAEKAEVTLAKSAYFEGDAVTFTVTADEDYEVTGVTMNGTPLTADNGTYSFTMPATAVTIVVTTKETYKEPTVEPNGDETITTPISDTAKDFIKEQFPAGGVVIKVEVNGDTLKGNAAVEMINKIVEMFSGNPFVVDDQGVAKLELVFKVDDVMAIVNGLTGGYTLKAGNATFNTEAYEVVPRWYDIDNKEWDVAAPQAGATKGFFKLKVQKKAN